MEFISEALFYLRIIVFPLCALGFVVSAVYEFQIGKSKLRLAIMLLVAASMLTWMSLTIAAAFNPAAMDDIRTWGVTPIVAALTIFIWSYAVARTRKR